MKTTSTDPGQGVIDTPEAARRILVLLAHPLLDRSEVNRPMVDAVLGLVGVTLVDLKAGVDIAVRDRRDVFNFRLRVPSVASLANTTNCSTGIAWYWITTLIVSSATP